MASPQIQALVTRQLTIKQDEQTTPVADVPAVPGGSDDSVPSPDKVPADNETAPVDDPTPIDE